MKKCLPQNSSFKEHLILTKIFKSSQKKKRRKKAKVLKTLESASRKIIRIFQRPLLQVGMEHPLTSLLIGTTQNQLLIFLISLKLTLRFLIVWFKMLLEDRNSKSLIITIKRTWTWQISSLETILTKHYSCSPNLQIHNLF